MKQALFLALSLSIGLSAFPAMAETTAEENLEKAGQTIDESVDRAEEAVEETVEETKEVIDEVGDKVEDTVERVEDKVEDLNDSERAKQLETMEKLEKRVDTPVGINQVRVIGRDGSTLVLDKDELEAIQAIVASYHDIDASLSDSLYLANSGSYGTAFQGITTMPGMLSSVDADDTELSTSPVTLQDARTMIKGFNTTASNFDNLILATGYLTPNADGSYAIDSERLANNVRWRIWADQGLKDLEKLDMNGQKISFATVGDTQLMRLGTREVDLSAGVFNPVIEAETVPINVFTTRVNAVGLDRDVILTGTKQGVTGPEVDLILHQQGPGPNQTAYRTIDQLADGSKRISTQVVSNLAGGSKLEILEERLISPDGVGIGTGVIQLNEKVYGISELGELRTMMQPDGSLVSYLDLDAGPQLLLHESGRGVANVAVIGADTEPVWTPMSLPAFVGRLNRIDNWLDELVDSQDDDN